MEAAAASALPLHRPLVPMRLIGTWEMERASTSAVPRIFSLHACRLTLFPFPSQCRSFVLTAKLEGYKRSLRSNEIVVGDAHGGAVEIPLDIAFNIQYPHFLKHKRNMMQIHVQRKRKYKNRPIPGGYKSVAFGAIDLTSMLQGGANACKSDIPLYAYQTAKHLPVGEMHSIGRLFVSSCSTMPMDSIGSTAGHHVKDKVLLSDDSEISDDDDSDPLEVHSGRRPGTSTAGATATGAPSLRDSARRKRAQRKNIKQRLANLLKRFRVPDDAAETAASSVGHEPTAKELQELFDELDDLSDSGNEGMAPDEISIVSNPRPALRPYFSSREHLPLPAISDERASESECGDEAEWSSEEGMPGVASAPGPGAAGQISAHGSVNMPPADPTTTPAANNNNLPSYSTPTANSAPWRASPFQQTSNQTPNQYTSPSPIITTSSLAHSQTAGSIAAGFREKDKVARNASLSDQLNAILTAEAAVGQTTRNGHNDCIWLCQVSDENMLNALTVAQLSNIAEKGGSPPLHLVPTHSLKDVRTVIQQLVTKIQNFCNSNSTPPPVTWVGVLGPDRLVSQVLRAYVDALQHKSSSAWLQFLRFILLVPPTSLTGRLMAGLDAQLECLSRDVWERWGDLTAAEQRTVADKMAAWRSRHGPHGPSLLNLPIGEVLLQLASNEREKELTDSANRIFVPFLAEVRVGADDAGEGASLSSPSPVQFVQMDRFQGSEKRSVSTASGPTTVSLTSRTPDPSISTSTSQASTVQEPSIIGGGSPPSSPATKGGTGGDTREMHVEYWMGTAQQNELALAPLPPNQAPTTPQGKKDSSKGSTKAHFRTLVVSRPSVTSMLALAFVKEKRKEKVLQKLGMKNKQSSGLDASPVQIANISRLLCSAQSKHNLTVFVDGCTYGDVRFFQTSSQWQTHVKHFPVALLSPGFSAS